MTIGASESVEVIGFDVGGSRSILTAVISQWVAPFEQTQSQGDEKVRLTSLSKQPDNQQPTVEAIGWVVDKAGNIYLVAQMPREAPHSTAQMSVECHPS